MIVLPQIASGPMLLPLLCVSSSWLLKYLIRTDSFSSSKYQGQSCSEEAILLVHGLTGHDACPFKHVRMSGTHFERRAVPRSIEDVFLVSSIINDGMNSNIDARR